MSKFAPYVITEAGYNNRSQLRRSNDEENGGGARKGEGKGGGREELSNIAVSAVNAIAENRSRFGIAQQQRRRERIRRIRPAALQKGTTEKMRFLRRNYPAGCTVIVRGS